MIITGYILDGGFYTAVLKTAGGRVNEDGDPVQVKEYKKRGLYFDEIPDVQND